MKYATVHIHQAADGHPSEEVGVGLGSEGDQGQKDHREPRKRRPRTAQEGRGVVKPLFDSASFARAYGLTPARGLPIAGEAL